MAADTQNIRRIGEQLLASPVAHANNAVKLLAALDSADQVGMTNNGLHGDVLAIAVAQQAGRRQERHMHIAPHGWRCARIAACNKQPRQALPPPSWSQSAGGLQGRHPGSQAVHVVCV